MDLLTKIKNSLRVTHSVLDDEVLDLIEACKVDLRISGLKTFDETNALVVFVITVYCKANFGFDNQDADRLMKTYMTAKQHLIFGQMGGVV